VTLSATSLFQVVRALRGGAPWSVPCCAPQLLSSRSPEATPPELDEGTRVGGWRVLRSLGRGGMSEVFAVVRDGSRQPAALKILRREAATKPSAEARFALESAVLAELRHPGVPAILDVGRCDDGRPYLVMELVQGVTLAEALSRAQPTRSAAFAILEQLCEVLAAAHRCGVVHRDLKPDNVILLEIDEPIVKLVDWGIAKRLTDDTGSVNLTSTGAIVGTPRYLSPEQARSETVDTRTDVYALGLLAYELLFGVHPFDAGSLGELLLMQMTKPPPSPRRFWPAIPAGLDHTLRAMLAKDPARRPSLSAVLASLQDAQLDDDLEPAAERHMRSGGLDLAETIADVPPGDRATSRWRPLRR
jgi:serine/threonine protein kinase